MYRGMNIGTAKPSKKERTQIKHHMIDLVSPRVRFSVDRFRTLAIKKIRDVVQRKRFPIVVGGSGMYIEALIDGLPPVESTIPEIRKRLENEAEENLEFLYKKLHSIDPARAADILPGDKRRIIRALEIYEVTGEQPSEWMKRRVSLNDLGFEWAMIGLKRDRSELYKRINLRVDQMIERGFISEVKKLIKTGLSLTAKQAVGYREIIQHLNEGLALPDAIEIMKRRTRQLAKKQLIWFRRESRIRWFSIKGNAYNSVITKVLKLYG